MAVEIIKIETIDTGKPLLDKVAYFLGILGFYFQCGAVFGYGWADLNGNYYYNPFMFLTSQQTPYIETSLLQCTLSFLILCTMMSFFSIMIDRFHIVRERYFGHVIVGTIWIISALFMASVVMIENI